jgi:hypothetical protein
MNTNNHECLGSDPPDHQALLLRLGGGAEILFPDK